MSGPLEPELWAITLPALIAARARGLEHIASGKYVSKEDLPKYEVNKAGWSTTTSRDYFGDKKSDPPNWRRIFGEKAGTFAAVAVSEVPELENAINQVAARAAADEEFGRRITVIVWDNVDEERRQQYVRTEYLDFVCEIIGRAEALGLDSDNDLLAIYLQIERAHFASTLQGSIVVPIALTALDLDDPLEIAQDLWIEPLSVPMQQARAISPMWGGRVSAYVVSAATHAIVMKNQTFDNSNVLGRMMLRDDLDLTSVETLIQAIYVTSDRSTGYAQVLVVPEGWADSWIFDLPAIWKLKTLHRYPDEFDDAAWNNKTDPVPSETLSELPSIYQALAAAPQNVALAARRVFRTLLRDDDEDQTLDATIGLEALLMGNNDRDEITHRMAQRCATALAADDLDPTVVFGLVKKVYEHRSAIVHGRTKRGKPIPLYGHTFAPKAIATFLLRRLLLNWLRQEEPWTPEILDARLLASLSKTPNESTE